MSYALAGLLLDYWHWLFLVAMLAMAVPLVALKRRRLELASWIFVSGLWLAASLRVIVTGGENSVVIAGQNLVVIMAGVLLGFRRGFAIVIASIAVWVGLLIADNAGFTPPPLTPPNLTVRAVFASFNLLAAGLIFYVARRSVDQALMLARRSEEKLAAYLERATDLILTLDTKARVTSVNAAAAQRLGFTPEQIIGRSALDFVIPEDRARVAAALQLILAGQPVPPLEARLLDHNGRSLWFEFRGQTEIDDGRILGSFQIARDITTRKVAEQDLARREQHYRALFEQTHDAVFILTLDFVIVSANQQAADLMGRQLDEMIGSDARINVAPDQLPQAQDRLAQALRGEHIPIYERTFIRKDGTRFPVEISLSLVRDESGQPLHIQSVVRDITDRKRIEQDLARREQLYRALFEQTHDAVSVLSLDFKIISVNQQTADQLGYTVSELIGTDARTTISPDQVPHAEETLAKILRGEFVPPYERIALRKDGTRLPVEISLSLVRDESGAPLHIQSVARDISLRKQLEKELKTSLAEMETLARTDPLTGLLNRRAILQFAEAEFNRAARSGEPVSVVLIDMDDLKAINDRHGHQTGDHALIYIAGALHRARRNYDWVGRWGGDEFIVVLPNADAENALKVAERLCQQINSIELPTPDGGPQHVQVSIGVATRPKTNGISTLTSLIRAADEALYNAKGAGNIVVASRDE